MDFLSGKRAIALLAHTLNFIENGAVITDASQPDNPVIFANKGFESMTGYSRSEVLGNNCRFLQGAETDRVLVEAMKKAIQEKKPFQGTFLNYRKNGTPFWNKVNIKPVQLENAVYFIGLQYNITEQTDWNAETNSAREAIEKAPVPIFSLNGSTLIVPLAGQQDPDRSLLLLEQLSGELDQLEIKKVIIDVTGFYSEEHATEKWIQSFYHTSQQLKAELIISGVSPKMEFYFTRLTGDVHGVHIYSSLQAAIQRLQ